MQNYSIEWLNEFLIKRESQYTNVFLFETYDIQRINQFISLAKGKLAELLKTDFKFYHWRLQKGYVVDADGVKLEIEPTVDTSELLTTQTSVLLISYAFLKEHVELLSEDLFDWSQSQELYRKGNTVVVFCSDAGLFNETLRRMCYTIAVPPSLEVERRNLMKKLIDDLVAVANIKLEPSEEIVQASAGLDLYSFQTAFLESVSRYGKLQTLPFTEHKKNVLRNYGLVFVEPKIGFEQVGGYAKLKQYVSNRIILPLKNPEIANYYGVGLPRGMIFYGLAGTGKSYFAEAMAKELGIAMVRLSPSDFFRGIVGESESRVRQITRMIEMLSPIMVFMDEVDQIAMARDKIGSGDSGVTRRVTNMLLEWLGQRTRQSFLIGATNFLEDIDYAFIRAGRIDEICLIPPPDFEARKEILEVHTQKLRKIPLAKTVDLNALAKMTAWWTGAELEKLALDSARMAMEEKAKFVEMKHFEATIKSLEVNGLERKQKLERMIAVLKKLENVNMHFLNETLKMIM
jgi:AAA+ superfamily predicted ATPase